MWLKIKWLVPAETGTAALCPSLYVPEPDLSFKSCVIRNLWFVFLKGSLSLQFVSKLALGRGKEAWTNAILEGFRLCGFERA